MAVLNEPHWTSAPPLPYREYNCRLTVGEEEGGVMFLFSLHPRRGRIQWETMCEFCWLVVHLSKASYYIFYQFHYSRILPY